MPSLSEGSGATIAYDPCPSCGKDPVTGKTLPSYLRSGCGICGGQGFVRRVVDPAKEAVSEGRTGMVPKTDPIACPGCGKELRILGDEVGCADILSNSQTRKDGVWVPTCPGPKRTVPGILGENARLRTVLIDWIATVHSVGGRLDRIARNVPTPGERIDLFAAKADILRPIEAACAALGIAKLTPAERDRMVARPPPRKVVREVPK